MNTSEFVLQGKNSTLRFQVLVDPATPEPDIYTIAFADFQPVEVQRLPGEKTSDFFARVVKILAELRAELETDDCPNLVGSYVHRKQRDRRWKYQFDWAQIYGASHADSIYTIRREMAVQALLRIIENDLVATDVQLQAIDILIRIYGIGQANETAK